MKKKILAILLCVMFTHAMAVSAFAEISPKSLPDHGEEVDVESAIADLNDQLNDINQQLVEIETSERFNNTQKEMAAKKAEYLKDLLMGRNVSMAHSDSQTNRVPFYPQQTDYYCGPASIQQVLGHYYYSPMPSQERIYTDTHGDTNDMRDYLNDHLNHEHEPGYIWFSVWWNGAGKNLKETITTIAGTGTPIIVHVRPILSAGRTSYTDTKHWPYKNPDNGHYMTISGYRNGGGQIELTDPFILWTDVGKSDLQYYSGKYYIDFTVLDPVGDRIIT